MSTAQSNLKPAPAHHHHDEPHHAVFPKGGDFFAWVAIGIVGALLLFVSVTAGELFSPGIRPGDVAEKDIIATHGATIIDAEATKKAVEDARERVIPVFRIDRSQDQVSLGKIKQSLDLARNLQGLGIAQTKELQALGITPEEHLFALICPNENFQVLSDPDLPEPSPPPLAGVMDSLKLKLSRPVRAPTAEVAATHGAKTPRKISKARGGKDGSAGGEARRASAMTDAIAVLRKQREALSEFRTRRKTVSSNDILIALSVRPADMDQYITATLESSKRLCDRFERFPVNDKNYWHGTVYEFLPDHWSELVRKHTATLICSALEPNVVIDSAATKAKADAATRAVAPVTKQIREGETVVRRGQIVTDERLQVLQLLAVKSVKSPTLLVVLGIALLCAIGFFALFLFTYEPQHFFSTTSISLLYTIGIVTSITASICGNGYAQFIPVPAAALVLTIFFGRRVAAAMILPLVLVLAVDSILSGVSLLSLGCAAMAAIVTYTKRRNALVFTGLAVGVAQAAGYLLAFGIGKLLPLLLGGHAHPAIISWLMMDFPAGAPNLQTVGLQFAGGIASAIIAIGSLPFLENIFGLITPYRLIELTDAEQPLLRQLEEKAPGTYQHSLAVANLAEAGAKAINADANLVRAGALYHDIGKMVKPRFFIENQLGATNPHDSMTPEESRERVLAHVTDGLEMAKKYALPNAVQDFIPMHQGTTLMAYFYHKACLRDGVENVDQNFYRYPGPKPHSKETAIVMLADVSEAVTHSMKDPTEEEVEEAIEKVFENRWQDEQFSESSLTYDELHRVKLAFVRVWRTLHHDRLKYPSTTTGRMPMAPNAVSAQNSSASSGSPAKTSPDETGAPDAVKNDPENGSNQSPDKARIDDDLGCDCAIAVFGPDPINKPKQTEEQKSSETAEPVDKSEKTADSANNDSEDDGTQTEHHHHANPKHVQADQQST